MSSRVRTWAWWYWLLMLPCLAWELAGQPYGAETAIGLGLVQILHFLFRHRSLAAFPLQVRVGYLLLLLLGLWPPLAFIYLIQLAGTTAMVVANYCFLARCLSLLPWNRQGPLSWKRLVHTLFSRPVTGSVATATVNQNRSHPV